jgi:hypothetical protein
MEVFNLHHPNKEKVTPVPPRMHRCTAVRYIPASNNIINVGGIENIESEIMIKESSSIPYPKTSDLLCERRLCVSQAGVYPYTMISQH